MLSVQVYDYKIYNYMIDKLGQFQEIAKLRNVEALAKAYFTISAKAFVEEVGIQAILNKRALHHIYEWNKIGDPKKRLFYLRRAGIGGGNIIVTAGFVRSKSYVPIPPALSTPTKRGGKRVSSKHIFRQKAKVMESGNPTRPYSAKKAKALVFLGNNGKPLFIRKPRTVTISNPGGKYTTGSFTKLFVKWFENPNNITRVVKASGLPMDLEKQLARTIAKRNSTTTDVSATIKRVSLKYSKDLRVV